MFILFMSTYTYLILLGLFFVVYFIFVSPIVNSLRKVTKDDELQKCIQVISQAEKFDKRSYDKGIAHLKNFMMHYSNSFSDDSYKKLKKDKYKTLHYFRRMVHRLHNDANLEHNLVEAIDNTNIILENYITEAYDRKGEHYFQSVG